MNGNWLRLLEFNVLGIGLPDSNPVFLIIQKFWLTFK